MMQHQGLRPLSLSELLDASFTMYRRLFVPLVFVAIVTQAIPIVLATYIELTGGPIENPGFWFASLIVTVIASSVGVAASTFLVAESYLGGSLTAQDALQRAVPFMGRLIGATMATSLLFFVGLIFLIAPGIWFLCGLALASPALVLENLNSSGSALNRSWALTKGFRGRIFVAFFVAFLLIAIPAIALGAASAMGGALASGGVTGVAIALLLIQAMLQVLAYPFFYVLTTLLYYDMRVRKEAYDLEMLASSLAT